MVAALFTEPVSPGAHAGLLVADADGYPEMSGAAVIAAVTIAIERNLLFAAGVPDGETPIVLDTAAGTVHARARLASHGGAPRVDAVEFTGVPAFVHTPSQPVRFGGRELRVDIAFGGRFYAIVDTESIGVPLDPGRIADLERVSRSIMAEVNAAMALRHPTEPAAAGLAGVIVTGQPADPEAHLRNVTVTSGGVVHRSPSGTGTAAVMAVLDAMGLLPAEQPFVHESITGALFRGRTVQRTQVGDYPAIRTAIAGSAWVTGEHSFLVDDDDPLRDGFTL
jgi:proline racemase